MTLRTRIVAALVMAALIPMLVVLAIPLAQAEKRADDETKKLLTRTRDQATVLVRSALDDARAAADRAAADLAGNRSALAAVVRGPEPVARPVAVALAERFALDGVAVLSASGVALAAAGADASENDAVTISERRQVASENETLTLVTTRTLGASFVAKVTAIASGEAHLRQRGPPTCPSPFVEVPVTEGGVLCVSVTPASAKDVRAGLLKSFAGVAPLALLSALAVGLVLAARISRPVRELAERAESISAQRSHPITLLPEKDETRRMTIAFDQMLDALQASERQRLSAERVAAWEEIARRLAHEIKNPLSPIQLAVENLERTRRIAPEAFDASFAVETRTIKEEVASLRTLVDEFAQFARLPQPRVAPCDPRAIARHAIALFSGRIESMRVTVALHEGSAPSSIRADAEQLGRVLKNVIANALDAMESADDRRLSITVRGEGDRVAFTVRDTGCGFDAETLRRIFEPYFTTRADRGGTGLGMAIARRIALEHGGSLHAEAAPGRGAVVTLTVPIAGPPTDDA
jgi:nitrogen fixation/metabolism regulation signal transduction histidine kinase